MRVITGGQGAELALRHPRRPRPNRTLVMPVVAGGLTVQQGLTEVTLTTRVDQSGSLKVSRKGRVIIEVEWPPC